ncbi:rhomboid family intramembrane serine protease [Mucilaginibacter mali]|uniref:Rhomboid family intramembrane serine protease n=1 Tax=Mucilaginibacter mali TaxID=2740462 RepID=A0A7D4TWT4_9SPHI|nr:rhomboid family intramembrane serine protease [Mucilaginibacter mali]QKJ31735.1 rhomboid family intramembrane serine protease [Mucilaginibacter mali]
MNNLWNEIRFKMLHSGSKIGLLIGINVLVFLLINIPGTIEQLFFKTTNIIDLSFKYLKLPASLPELAKHFWTPITYMFMHAGVLHILYNMVWLYWMGQIFEEYLGNKRILVLYFLGGLVGAAFFVAGMNLIPLFREQGMTGISVVGASAGVMAVVVATATLLPDYQLYLMFIGPVRLKWLAIAFVIMDFLGTAGPNSGGEMAHLGGALIGFLYIKQLQRGNDWNKPLNKLFNPKPKLTVVKGGAGKTIQPSQAEIDRILDKISVSGKDSLSKQEKETLLRASKNDN